MKPNRRWNILLAATVFGLAPLAYAHHAITAEYPGSSSPTLEMIGEVTKVRWRAPHVEVYVKVTGGDVDAGNWVVNSHSPGLLARTYGIMPDDVKVGDKVRFLGWKSRFNVPRFHMRAISINDGPMRSTLRPADSRAISDGTLGEVIPAPGLDSSPLQPGEE